MSQRSNISPGRYVVLSVTTATPVAGARSCVSGALIAALAYVRGVPARCVRFRNSTAVRPGSCRSARLTDEAIHARGGDRVAQRLQCSVAGPPAQLVARLARAHDQGLAERSDPLRLRRQEAQASDHLDR